MLQTSYLIFWCAVKISWKIQEKTSKSQKLQTYSLSKAVSYQKKLFPCSSGALLSKYERPTAHCRKAYQRRSQKHILRLLYTQSEKPTVAISLLYGTNVSCVFDDAFGSFSFPGSLPQVSAGYSQDCVCLA